MDEKKEKRVLTIELDENVKKVSITGLGDDETVVMKEELTEEELDQATGGMPTSPYKCSNYHGCPNQCPTAACYYVECPTNSCPNYCRAACTVND